MEMLWALAACAALNGGARRMARPTEYPPMAASVAAASEKNSFQAAGALSLGMRRLAADLGFVRLLIYYGVPEIGLPENVLEDGGGLYPEIFSRAQKILAFDPRFDYVVLYAAGSLGFNLNRPDQAVSLLNQAIALNPGNTRYRALLAAVGVKNRGNATQILSYLSPILSQPGCPTLLKSLAAFLDARVGRVQDALALYRDIAQNSPDAGYRRLAKLMITKLESR